MKDRIDFLKKLFPTSLSNEERHHKLMHFGRQLPPFSEEWKNANNRVDGCQSLLYLHPIWDGEKLAFRVFSEALISAGLAALLVHVYSGASPEEILTSPPLFLEELGIFKALSPSRSNGVAHVHGRIQQTALSYLK